MSAVFLLMGAVSFFGPTTAAHAQESTSCATAAATWTPQEAWVWRQLCLGEIADLDSITRFGDRSEPNDAAAWSGGRVISSQFLQTILVEKEYSRLFSDHPVHIAGAWFREEVDLSESSFPFSLYFSNSRFDKSFDLTSADIGGSIGFWSSAVKSTLDLNSVRVAGLVQLHGKSSFQDVDLTAAEIKSSIVADGSTFHKELDMNSAHVGGSVFLRKASFQNVDLTVAEVESNVEADGSTFHKKLDVRGARIGGFVFLRNRALFQDVDLTAAEIAANVDAYGSTFHKGLSLSTAKVNGSVYLYSSSFHDINLVGASIGGSADLSGSYFDGNVYLSNVKVMGILALGLAHWSDGSALDLRATSVLGIDDDVNAWPDHVYLTGFTYQLASGYATQAGHGLADRDMSWYDNWLERDQSFARQPYKQVETMLRSVGRDRDADVIAMKSIDRQYHERNQIYKAAGRLHRSTVGYGYRPERIIPWALALVLVGGIVAKWLPQSVTMKVSSRYILSAQHLIPLINFGKTYADADVTSPEVRPWVRRYFYFHSFMGWVLAGLLVAALAGITATTNG